MGVWDSMRELNGKGMAALNAGRYEDAIYALRCAVRLAGRADQGTAEAALRNNLALVFQQAGFVEEAENHFRVAMYQLAGRTGRATPLYGAIARNLARLRGPAAS
jgi:Flp pilus assembly protein TadD